MRIDIPESQLRPNYDVRFGLRCGFAANTPMSVSPERKKIQEIQTRVFACLTDTYSKRIRYSSMPRGVERPSIALRSLAKALIACSALLLFQGIPSWLRKVNSLSRSLSNRAFNFKAAALRCSILEIRL